MNTTKIGEDIIISIDHFSICSIDGKTREEIVKLYKKEQVTNAKVVYYIEKFTYHLKQLGTCLEDYIRKNLQEEWPKCPSSGKDLPLAQKGRGKDVRFLKLAVPHNQENNDKYKQFCERLKISRKGAGNPMFGKDSWNKGQTKENNEIISEMSKKAMGRKASDETREKIRLSQINSPFKNRHNQPHSEETKQKLREITASRYANGCFKRETRIHISMREFLKTLNLVELPIEEYHEKYYSLDFAFPESKVVIECQGTYFHVDPRKYPNGPQSAVQRRNFGRDKAKRKFLENRGWTLIEVWEKEITENNFQEELKCNLKELNLLKASE